MNPQPRQQRISQPSHQIDRFYPVKHPSNMLEYRQSNVNAGSRLNNIIGQNGQQGHGLYTKNVQRDRDRDRYGMGYRMFGKDFVREENGNSENFKQGPHKNSSKKHQPHTPNNPPPPIPTNTNTNNTSHPSSHPSYHIKPHKQSLYNCYSCLDEPYERVTKSGCTSYNITCPMNQCIASQSKYSWFI